MHHDAGGTTESVVADKMLTAIEVAERLRVCRSTVYNLVASGELRAYRHGKGKVRPRGLRIPESAIAEYLNPVPTPAPDAAPVLAA